MSLHGFLPSSKNCKNKERISCKCAFLIVINFTVIRCNDKLFPNNISDSYKHCNSRGVLYSAVVRFRVDLAPLSPYGCTGCCLCVLDCAYLFFFVAHHFASFPRFHNFFTPGKPWMGEELNTSLNVKVNFSPWYTVQYGNTTIKQGCVHTSKAVSLGSRNPRRERELRAPEPRKHCNRTLV